MNSGVWEKCTAELLKLFKEQSEALYGGQHSLCLNVPCVVYLQKRFAQLQEASSSSVSGPLVPLQLLREHLSQTQSLKLITDRTSSPLSRTSTITLSLEPFRALQILHLKKVPLCLLVGLQRLRGQLRVLIVQRCELEDLEDLIVRCGQDNSTTLAWGSLKELDLSNNLVTRLGKSLQYMHGLEKVNFSHNMIGHRPCVPLKTSGGDEGEQSIAAVVIPDQSGNGLVDHYTEGVQSIDNVQFLHLGFNKLRLVPRFGSRAKYNLRILNLRNNELVIIDGLEELDNLVDLDLTDNLLGQHSSLKPFQYLHHLSVLALQGNPLSFHPKHRLKTAENLSNLIEKTTFKLNGKKLTSAERKVVPSTMTHHYSSFMTASQSLPANLLSSINGTVPSSGYRVEPIGDDQVGEKVWDPVLTTNGTVQTGSTPNKKGRKVYAAVIVDSDEEQPIPTLSSNHNGDISEKLHLRVDGEKEVLSIGKKVDHKRRLKGSKKKKKKVKNRDEAVLSSVPLLNADELKKNQDMRLMMPNHWLQGSLDKSSSITDDQGGAVAQGISSKANHSSSQNNMTVNSSDNLSCETNSSTRQSDKGSSRKRGRRCQHLDGTGKDSLVDVVLHECDGACGPRTSSPDRASPVELDGEHFVVERYESDVEDERVGHGGGERVARDQVIIRLSDRFLAEMDTNGKCIDRWDLHSLKAVSVDSKFWTPTAQKMEVLLLHFNLERRDRRHRGYVLMEEKVGEGILKTLKPVVEQNESTLSMDNELECLQCQRIFDRAQAMEQPSDSPEPLHYSASFNRRSISKLKCPFCHSQILQQSMRSSFKSVSKMSQGSPNGAAAVADPYPIYTSSDKIHPQFKVDDKKSGEWSRTNHLYSDRNTGLVDFVDNSNLLQHLEAVSIGINHSNDRKNPNDENDSSVMSYPSEKKCVEVSRSENPDKDGKPCVNADQNSPVEESYLQGFDLSFVGSEPSFSTSQSDREHVCGTTAPISPAIEDAFQSHGERNRRLSDLKQKMLLLEGGDSSNARGPYSNDDENRFGKARMNGHDENEISGSAPDQWMMIPHNGTSLHQDFMDYDYPEPSTLHDPTYHSPFFNLVAPHHTMSRVNADFSAIPDTMISTSVPSHNYMPDHFSQIQGKRNAENDDSFQKIFEDTGIIQSRSGDLFQSKCKSSMKKQSLVSQPEPQDPKRSFTGVEEDNVIMFASKEAEVITYSNSRKNSMCSADSDSGAGSKSNSASSSKKYTKRDGQGLGETVSKGYSSAESSRYSRRKDTEATDKSKEGSTLSSKIIRVLSLSDLRSSNRGKNVGGSRKSSGKQTSGGVCSRTKKLERINSSHILSDGGGREKRAESPIVIYRDEDPNYIHNSLQLFLVMDVFGGKEECFKMVFRSSMIRYGEPGELPVLVVVSNIRAYVFRVVAPESSEPKKWLRLSRNHSLRKLVYIDHGVNYQYLRVEFKSPACYTFLMRDDKKCKLCSNQLSLCVADAPGSSLRNVGMCVFNIEAIRHPDQVLQEVLQSHYDGGSVVRKSPTRSLGHPFSTKQSSADSLLLYRLVHRRCQHTTRWSPVTLAVLNDTLFLAKENFAHWPLPRLLSLPPKEALLPPYLDVEQRDITDVERLILDREQLKFIILCFFDETTGSGHASQWNLALPTPECVTKLSKIVKTTWETQFEMPLPISYI